MSAFELRLGEAPVLIVKRLRMTWRPFACEFCGVVFSAFVRVAGDKMTTRRFCSRACRRAFVRPELHVKSGPDNAGWKGDAVSVRGGRTRALRAFPNVGPCSRCGAGKAERHHRDDNTANNSPDNIAILCRRCHMEADGRMASVPDRMRKIQPLGVAARWR